MTEVVYLQFGSVAFSIDPRDISEHDSVLWREGSHAHPSIAMLCPAWLPVDVNQPKGRCLSSITGSAIDDQGTWLIGGQSRLCATNLLLLADIAIAVTDPFLKNVYSQLLLSLAPR